MRSLLTAQTEPKRQLIPVSLPSTVSKISCKPWRLRKESLRTISSWWIRFM
ncbi:unnamed protein product [Cladocopium goreaui]|uniref:Uncharacterized protein n=1 Tax=Cladocopium goreaui TaxID=2562237 RepID=A0A9P1BXL3_9DINO|nr:unnamed protein product [Cladocopium goreaui]